MKTYKSNNMYYRYPLSKKEAIIEMKKGNKITHSTFTEEEWIIEIEGLIHMECGNVCTKEVFWKYRQMNIWNNNYKVFR